MIFGALGAAPLGDDGVFSAGTAYVLVADAGVFSLAGQDVALLFARRLVADAGVFSLAGQDVGFVFTTSSGAAFARALHRHAQLGRQGSRPAVLAVQVLAAAPKGRISTKGLGGP